MTKVLKTIILCLLFILSFSNLALAAGGGEMIGYFFVVVLILVVIFLIIREVVCWYWKINTIVELLQQINARLGGDSRVVLEGAEPGGSGDPKSEKSRVCPECGVRNPLNSKFCEECGSPMK
ncbi:MAG TPA: zinc ribbon domain-containing protein [candidate division Zixibacteria bacterium]